MFSVVSKQIKRWSLATTIVSATILVSLLGASFTALAAQRSQRPQQPASYSDANYFFDQYVHGHKYQAEYTKYKRYGPLKEEIEANSQMMFGPETSSTRVVWEVTETGQMRPLAMRVNSADGNEWYTYTYPDANKSIVTNHMLNEQHEEPLPAWNSQTESPKAVARANYADVYKSLGWDYEGEGILNGRTTVIYADEGLIQKPQERFGEGIYRTPVMYDLDQHSYRAEVQIDKLSGTVMQYSRYIGGTSGEAELVESWVLDSLRQVN